MYSRNDAEAAHASKQHQPPEQEQAASTVFKEQDLLGLAFVIASTAALLTRAPGQLGI